MLAMARALMVAPKILLLDEPSMGLSPLFVETIFDNIVSLNKAGKTILLVEQNANLALNVSSYAYVLEAGKVLLEGPSTKLQQDPQVQAAYLGV